MVAWGFCFLGFSFPELHVLTLFLFNLLPLLPQCQFIETVIVTKRNQLWVKGAKMDWQILLHNGRRP